MRHSQENNTAEEIINRLREAEVVIAAGRAVGEAAHRIRPHTSLDHIPPEPETVLPQILSRNWWG